MRVKVKGDDDLVTLVGNLLEVPAGSVLLCEGEWRVDKRYGQQFQCETWEEVMPATAYGIEKYLGSGLMKGIGPKFAKLIVGHFFLFLLYCIIRQEWRRHWLNRRVRQCWHLVLLVNLCVSCYSLLVGMESDFVMHFRTSLYSIQ